MINDLSRRRLLKLSAGGALTLAVGGLTNHLVGQWLKAERDQFAVEDLQNSVTTPDSGDVHVSFCLVDCETNAMCASLEPDRAVICGSLRKLFVASAGLMGLGPGFCFVTSLNHRHTGDGKDCVRIVGSGDPTLTQENLQSLALQVSQKEPFAFVEGDGTCFDAARSYGADTSESDRPGSRPAGFYARQLLGQVAGLSVGRGVRHVYAAPSPTIGAPTIVTISGGIDPFHVVNRARTTSGDTECQIYRAPSTNDLFVLGDVGQSSVGYGVAPLLHPDLDTAKWLASYLGSGSRHLTPTRALIQSSAVLTEKALATHRSVPMVHLVQQLLKRSDALLGECLLRSLGLASSRQGSTDAGCREEKRILKSAGLAVNSTHFRDGSGLDPDTRASSREICQLLRRMYTLEDTSLRVAFVNGLAVPGEENTTLSSRFLGGTVRGRVKAKTGTLLGHHSLAGYLTGLSGRTYSFAVLVSSQTTLPEGATRAAIDRFVENLIGRY